MTIKQTWGVSKKLEKYLNKKEEFTFELEEFLDKHEEFMTKLEEFLKQTEN